MTAIRTPIPNRAAPPLRASTTQRKAVWHAFGALFVVLALGQSAQAGETIRWRTDYNSARREANEKGLPLFLDFGTEDCYHCRRLEATTFRDPTVAALLNERFVPLKIDANREPALAQALRIQAYPTMVLAATDGKILGVLEGYLEAGRLTEHLQRAMAASTPDWMARDFQEASKAIGAADYARAVSLLKGVLEDGKSRPVQDKARQVLAEIEQQAAGRLARAKQMDDRGQSLEAADVLTGLLKDYAGTHAASDGAKLLAKLADKPDLRNNQRAGRARELLAQAKEDYRTQNFLACLDRCQVLESAYKDLPEGTEGAKLAGEIRGNPERMAQACEQMNERLAGMYMALADSWMEKGQPQQAAPYLEKVAKLCPGSPQAEAAQVRLTQLQGKPPTQTVEFKKPAP